VEFSFFSKTIRQPLVKISFPVVLNGTSAALARIVVLEISESG